MTRSLLRYGYPAAVLILAAAVISGGGCVGALSTLAYWIKGTNIDAEFDGLEGKKVVVVCRPVADLTYRTHLVNRDLAREVSRLLQANVPKIQVIPQREVVEWLDENGDWDHYGEVGQALGADMVVGIDLRDFNLLLDQTLYQGTANVSIVVYDCARDAEPIFEKEPPQTVYPPNVGIPVSERQERQFSREFVLVLAEEIGRCFYDHDAHADYAMDAKAFQ